MAAAFRQHAAARLAAIDALLWDGSSGQWRDLIMGEPEAQGQPSSKPASASAAVEGSPPAPALAVAGSARGAAASELQPPSPGEIAGAAGAAPAVCSSYRHSDVVAASNWLPLYCGCAQAGSSQAAAAVASLRSSGLLQAAGVAVTLRETGQQWDWPNAWPPITAMLIEGCAAAGGTEGQQVGPMHSCGCGLMRAGSLPSAFCLCSCGGSTLPQRLAQAAVPLASACLASHLHLCLSSHPFRTQLATQLAQQYLTTAHAAWRQSGRMHEKFDALHCGAPGGGGEYACEDGFGWTNGVALSLLQRFGWQAGAAAAAPTDE